MTKRLKAVLDFVESHIDKPLTLDELCQVANLSKFHFHRQCSAYFGISVYQFIKLLRMKRAAFQLAFRTEKKVIDIALSNGYDSHEAFSRAFNKVFGLSPSAFRRTPDWHSWHQHYQNLVQFRMQAMTEHANYQVDLVNFPETPIAVMTHKGDPRALGHTIQRFIAWRKQMKLPPSKSRTFNLVYHDPNTVPPEEHRFDLACVYQGELLDDESDVVKNVIPEGRCARIRHIGSDDLLGPVVDYLYSIWLVQNEVEVREFPLFFERVSFFPEVKENDMITDVYLPIL